MKRIYTKGNVEVQNIKLGDVQYEFGYGQELKSTVIELPREVEPGYWQWKNKTDNHQEIVYGVRENMGHYGPNIYTYRAYKTINHKGETI